MHRIIEAALSLGLAHFKHLVALDYLCGFDMNYSMVHSVQWVASPEGDLKHKKARSIVIGSAD